MSTYINETAPMSDNEFKEYYSIDELLSRRGDYTGKKFIDILEFVSGNISHSIFNNLLVYLQNPDATFYTTAQNWETMFGRRVRQDAKPIFIISSKTPVVLLYDIADTDGLDIHSFLSFRNNLLKTNRKSERISHETIELIIRNSNRDKISVTRKSALSVLTARTLTEKPSGRDNCRDNKFIIEMNSDLNPSESFLVLCRELAHIYLGHYGTDADRWWPDREELPAHLKTMEAEAVVFLLSKRKFLHQSDASCLMDCFRSKEDMDKISIELIIKTASFFERMAREVLRLRKTNPIC